MHVNEILYTVTRYSMLCSDVIIHHNSSSSIVSGPDFWLL